MAVHIWYQLSHSFLFSGKSDDYWKRNNIICFHLPRSPAYTFSKSDCYRRWLLLTHSVLYIYIYIYIYIICLLNEATLPGAGLHAHAYRFFTILPLFYKYSITISPHAMKHWVRYQVVWNDSSHARSEVPETAGFPTKGPRTYIFKSYSWHKFIGTITKCDNLFSFLILIHTSASFTSIDPSKLKDCITWQI